MKKRILTVALVIALLATCFAGTVAYLTDTDEQVNTFTTGNVQIKLDEVVPVKNTTTGNLDAGTTRTENDQDDYKLFPAMTVAKDPTITVEEGSEDAWIAAKITVVGDLYSLIGVENYDNIDITKLASGGLMSETAKQVTGWKGLSMVYETDSAVVYQVADKASNTWTLYVFVKTVKSEENTVTLFTTLTIPEEYDNEQMAKLNNMKISVDAYAVQANGFADCYTAMTTAFADAFNFV